MNAPNQQGDQFSRDELQRQLADKEELIVALTAQLEQAADELDRRHRSGYDRGMTISAPSLPPELIEHQKNITAELQEAVQRWEDMQVSLTLGRLETQLLEIRDLIVASPAQQAEGRGNQRSTNTATRQHKQNGRPGETCKSEGDQSTSSHWDSLKTNILDDDAETLSENRQSTGESNADAIVESPHPIVDTEREDDCGFTHEELWNNPLPVPVDFESADAAMLRSAVEARDAFIVGLTRRLRAIPAKALPVDWSELSSVPDELQNRLEELAKRYDEKLRCAEIEISLERAKLSRVEAQLQEQQEQIAKQMKRLGLSTEAEPESVQQNDQQSHETPSGKSSLWKLLVKK